MINRDQSFITAALVTGAFVTSPFVNGMPFMGVNITPTTALLAAAVAAIVCFRLREGLPIVPLLVFKEPAVLSALLYFAIGLCTGFIVDNEAAYRREIIQRITIIWLPMYALAFGVRKIEHAKNFLLCYIPSAMFLSGMAGSAGAQSGFKDPAYVFMHKNMSAGLCATMVLICIAHLLTSRRLKIQVWKLQIPNKLLFGLLTAFGLFGIIGAQGRSALVSVLVGSYIMMFGMRVKPLTLIKSTLIVVVVGGLLYKFMPEQAIEHALTVKVNSSNAVRIQLWTEMFNNLTKYPFTCSGWGNPYIDSRGWYYYDLACVLLFDWMQMTFVGAGALVIMICCSVGLGLSNARQLNPHSVEAFVNLAAIGIIASKFTCGMLDTFWIARGTTLHTWIAVGICLFIKLWIEQNKLAAIKQRGRMSGVQVLATAKR